MAAKYTVNEVEERTQVPASTLRQWERRYGFPMPARSESGYRLYSDHDIEQIDAMRRYIEDGVPASRAAALVKNASKSKLDSPKPPQELSQALIQALIQLDEARADQLLSEAHAMHPVEKVLLEMIKPAMVEIGNLWHRGELKTTTEHFSSSYIYGKLRGLFSLAANIQTAPTVIVACAEGDYHELGALMLAIFVRRAGYRVFYIGANTPIKDLAIMSTEQEPIAVMLSAATADTISTLEQYKTELRNLAPIIIYGGLGFDMEPDKAKALGGHYLSADLNEAILQFSALVKDQKVQL